MYTRSMVSPAPDSPQGMHVVYADREDAYKISYVKDVPYCERNGRSLTMQMLFPEIPAGLAPGAPFANPNMKRPLVVFVQGSAWMKQDCYMNLPNLIDLARAGFVVASVEYRPSSEAPWPGFLVDVKAAIRFLKANSAKFGINKTRVGIWGDSSGGHTALLVGATGDVKEFDDHICPEEDSAVSAVCSFYGLSDISRINDAPRAPQFANAPSDRVPENLLFRGDCAKNPELTVPANPINYISADHPCPPFLMFHGDEDAMVPFLQSELMYEKLRQCGKNVEFYKVKGADHGTRLWTKEVLDIVTKFFKCYL